MNLFAALVASAAVVAAAQNDIPHNGDNMLVLLAQRGGPYVAVDMDRQVTLPDGRTSVILLVVTPDAAQAGRVAVDCKARTTQIISAYTMSVKGGEVTGEDPSQIEKTPGGGAKGSPSETLVMAVCGVVPSLPQSDKPAAHARGQQITEL